jgi:glycosyltransferase involved in cell wall biosynthesis
MAWGGAAVLDGLCRAARSYAGKFSLLQREFISTLSTVEPLTKKPRILDVDDAIWLFRGGRAARRLASVSDKVICGNSFIAEQFSKWSRNIEIIPTAVDTGRYIPRGGGQVGEEFVIGWCGTSSGFAYLSHIEPPLKTLLELPNTRLLVISNERPQFPSIDPRRVNFVPWSDESEVAGLQRMSVGIMPLDDSDWSRGKCSCKMLSYMASGLPVVVSDFGMNSEILAADSVGIGVRTLDEWTEALIALYKDPARGLAYGRTGRKVVEETFSLSVICEKLVAAIRSVTG